MAISDKVRQQICAAANYRCEYCKTSSKLTGMPLVMDHILPQVAGGSDEPENIAAACYRCNRKLPSCGGNFRIKPKYGAKPSLGLEKLHDYITG
jgi:5-methylcytosine-specific restriction endonuclease McrA